MIDSERHDKGLSILTTHNSTFLELARCVSVINNFLIEYILKLFVLNGKFLTRW